MSPKNSVPAIVNMLEKTSCHRIISQAMMGPLVSPTKAALEKKQFTLEYEELPDLLQIFPGLSGDAGKVDVVPFPAPVKPHDMDDIVLYLHSSGSTGFPKPIPQSQVAVLQWSSSCAYVSRLILNIL